MRYDFRFIKYQGCGNDFVLKDELDGPATPDEDRSAMAKFLWDRHFWIGADGVLFVESAPGLDGSMRLFEPAGNEADMCGNGLRCVAAFLMDKLGKEEVDVLTRDGVKRIKRTPEGYRVDMGPVRTRRKDLSQYVSDPGGPEDSMLTFPLDYGKGRTIASIANTGEPHIVVFVKDIDVVDVVGAGETLNSDRGRFPKGVNINFVQVLGPHSISVRTYERGVYDESMACGTGATACVGVSLMMGKVAEGPVTVKTRGGPMKIEMSPDGHAVMIGPATKVFEGQIAVEV